MKLIGCALAAMLCLPTPAQAAPVVFTGEFGLTHTIESLGPVPILAGDAIAATVTGDDALSFNFTDFLADIGQTEDEFNASGGGAYLVPFGGLLSSGPPGEFGVSRGGVDLATVQAKTTGIRIYNDARGNIYEGRGVADELQVSEFAPLFGGVAPSSVDIIELILETGMEQAFAIMAIGGDDWFETARDITYADGAAQPLYLLVGGSNPS